jgi:deoxyxylulose-5-phosphate synthase
MNNSGNYPLLDQISTPDDVRKLSKNQLFTLADEVRRY